ncbi:hypothetical protein [Luteolibacter luteus]|uniref:Uncharacterized protein n=1 Tax=Luteolibacter luteus TaxID=2728835 RepID=A0A858RFF5_9BACT|nr:hypothetical protein [Luteolibacter luteus]QJE95472.1 hypothetical protein HHL09_06650 [Luteolibacter luteus]
MQARRSIRYSAIILLLGLAAGGAYILSRPDIYHTKERREAKDSMIQAVSEDLALQTPPARPTGEGWMNEKVIFCGDGSWLSYRSQCHKQDPKVHDLFITKASDGKWYYSTYHFCIGALVLEGDGQPGSLDEFRGKYALAEFDGESDAALGKTWPDGK